MRKTTFDFSLGAVLLALWSLGVAQQVKKVPRIGYLGDTLRLSWTVSMVSGRVCVSSDMWRAKYSH